MQAGKHVICEKPFTGYFGRTGDAAPIGKHVPKALMFERVTEEMHATVAAIRASGRLFLYAENWVYAPAVSKTAEIVRATGDKILFIKAEESHSGSHAAHAAQLVDDRRRRADPPGLPPALGGALSEAGGSGRARRTHHRRRRHLRRRHADLRPRGGATPPSSRRGPEDVEDWGMLSLTFSDGTKATIVAGDMVVGGVRNLVETYTTGGVLFANITPNTHVVSYLTDETKLGDVYITEKVDRKTGWQFVCVEEEFTRGYTQEIQDFMECAAHGREPRAGLDLACEAIRVQYAAYVAAEEGRRVRL